MINKKWSRLASDYATDSISIPDSSDCLSASASVSHSTGKEHSGARALFQVAGWHCVTSAWCGILLTSCRLNPTNMAFFWACDPVGAELSMARTALLFYIWEVLWPRRRFLFRSALFLLHPTPLWSDPISPVPMFISTPQTLPNPPVFCFVRLSSASAESASRYDELDASRSAKDQLMSRMSEWRCYYFNSSVQPTRGCEPTTWMLKFFYPVLESCLWTINQ